MLDVELTSAAVPVPVVVAPDAAEVEEDPEDPVGETEETWMEEMTSPVVMHAFVYSVWHGRRGGS